MALDLYFKEDIRATILAGLVLAIQTDQGRNAEYLRGCLAAYQHQAHVFNIAWPGVLSEARLALTGDNLSFLLDVLHFLEV